MWSAAAVVSLRGPVVPLRADLMDIFGIFRQRKQRLDELAAAREKTRRHSGRIRVKSRIEEVCDPRSTSPLFADIIAGDPLEFPDYAAKTAELARRSGLNDAFICAEGSIAGRSVVCVELVPEFLMGSMGTAVGEAVCRGAEYALANKLPLIIFSASGGARMQEGMFSLMQMAKTSAAIRRLSDAGGLFISIFTHPTTGGVTASFASLGDIHIAEPGALIGFAGPRVIEQTIGASLPEGFQRSEFQLAHGFVDCIVPRNELRDFLTRLLAMHPPTSNDLGHSEPNLCHCGLDPQSLPQSLVQIAGQARNDTGQPRQDAGAPQVLHTSLSPQQHVEIARNPARPHAPAFIKALFEDFIELHGDRLYRDDKALLGGLALFDGHPVTVAAHLKGDDLNSNIACNFGMPHPEGYRKFIRLARQAEKFRRPLITFIDTPGAYPGAEAEERGQGEAIARCLFELSGLRVPIIAVLTGEGNSGGALALALADRVIMLKYAVYSVLSPEGFASILWKDAKRVAEACTVMKLTADDLYQAQLVDMVVEEVEGGMHLDAEPTFNALRIALRKAIADVTKASMLAPEELLQLRYQKYRKFGRD